MSTTNTTAGSPSAASPEPFSCEVTQDNGLVRLVVRGEMDIAANAEFERCCREALERDAPVEIDLEGVSFMDSMGLRVLVGLLHDSADANRPRIIAASEPVSRILELTKTRQLFGL
jgi:anti-anti-sigma factor